ncbi:MAG: YkgJ family cysteine cluster protein [Chloroflexi bacterium]|nr:YkgJ family cysteine cluster protein [Chloroflexota bacterium]
MAGQRTCRKPACSMCGTCCRKLGAELTMTQGDYRRWKRQGREDILRYAYIIPKGGGRGILWFDLKLKLELDRCPFLTETPNGRHTCAIQETKPRVCKRFWCEWTYGAGDRGIPFKVDQGWTLKARQSGYGKAEKHQPIQNSNSNLQSRWQEES